jgi:hypothetical protein
VVDPVAGTFAGIAMGLSAVLSSLLARRDALKLAVAAGAMGLPALRAFSPGAARAAGLAAYDPANRFDLAVKDVELRRNSAGRMLMARIYQPQGASPFPGPSSRPCSICTAVRGTERTASPRSRWIAHWRQAGCWSSPST